MADPTPCPVADALDRLIAFVRDRANTDHDLKATDVAERLAQLVREDARARHGRMDALSHMLRAERDLLDFCRTGDHA